MIDLNKLTPFTVLGTIAFLVLFIYLLVLIFELSKDHIRHVKAKKIKKNYDNNLPKFENPPAPPKRDDYIEESLKDIRGRLNKECVDYVFSRLDRLEKDNQRLHFELYNKNKEIERFKKELEGVI